MTDNILQLMEKQTEQNRNPTEFKKLNNKIKPKIKKTKL